MGLVSEDIVTLNDVASLAPVNNMQGQINSFAGGIVAAPGIRLGNRLRTQPEQYQGGHFARFFGRKPDNLSEKPI